MRERKKRGNGVSLVLEKKNERGEIWSDSSSWDRSCGDSGKTQRGPPRRKMGFCQLLPRPLPFRSAFSGRLVPLCPFLQFSSLSPGPRRRRRFLIQLSSKFTSSLKNFIIKYTQMYFNTAKYFRFTITLTATQIEKVRPLNLFSMR